jgi:hypothetical protein
MTIKSFFPAAIAAALTVPYSASILAQTKTSDARGAATYPMASFPTATKSAAAPKRTAPFGRVFDMAEVRPIFDSERNILSIPIGLGLSTEAGISGRWCWNAEIDHFQVGRKDMGAGDGFNIQDVVLERHAFKSTSGFGGVRYYADPSGESIYAGAKLGFRRVDATWKFDGGDTEEVSHFAPFLLEAGYRIVPDEHYSVRLGARVSRDYVLSQQIKNQRPESESLKIRALRYNYESILDLGVAYYF